MTGFSGRRAALTTKLIFFILQLCTPFTLPLYFWKCLRSFLSVILIFQGSCEFVSFRIALECFTDSSELGDPFSPILFSRSSYFPLWKNSRQNNLNEERFLVVCGFSGVNLSHWVLHRTSLWWKHEVLKSWRTRSKKWDTRRGQGKKKASRTCS